MRYLPHTPSDIQTMLEAIGVRSVDELFDAVPPEYRLEHGLNLEPALDEASLMSHLAELASRNRAVGGRSFLGAGIYDHHIPPAVDQLINRSEFYTAYTPYQSEVSQGTLMAVFEFQTIVAEVFGMEVSNASMYDAASAAAEAALMARRITRRGVCLVSEALHPEYVETIKTYLGGVDNSSVVLVPATPEGTTDWAQAEALCNDQSACLIIGYPNFFGVAEDLERARALTDDHGALLVTTTAEPYALSVLKPPGAFGADIAVGEGQGLAAPPSLGGPGVGLFACREKYLRQIPGRLVGQTVDADGQRGFVLTLNTREQHIRRERATSNICTNHGLMALAMTIRVAMLGRVGFERVGRHCLSQAEYLKNKIQALSGFEVSSPAPTFNEFVVSRLDGAAAPLLAALAAKGVLGGVDLGRFFTDRSHQMLVAVTERHRKQDLDHFVETLAST